MRPGPSKATGMRSTSSATRAATRSASDETTRTYYTGTSRPERTDFTLDMVMNASAETPYETGMMRFNTGRARDWMTSITYSE